jgi:crotonobetainyl-CoA:carnitine CoA-transferase CaiB-like acyl-CoA transferase
MRMTRMQPRLGEHSAEVLRECGYDDATIERLTAEGGACRGVQP